MAENAVSTFRQLEERQVEVQVHHFIWSNKIDILALALENGEVVLYRLNWQKVRFSFKLSNDTFVIHPVLDLDVPAPKQRLCVHWHRLAPGWQSSLRRIQLRQRRPLRHRIRRAIARQSG